MLKVDPTENQENQPASDNVNVENKETTGPVIN